MSENMFNLENKEEQHNLLEEKLQQQSIMIESLQAKLDMMGSYLMSIESSLTKIIPNTSLEEDIDKVD